MVPLANQDEGQPCVTPHVFLAQHACLVGTEDRLTRRWSRAGCQPRGCGQEGPALSQEPQGARGPMSDSYWSQLQTTLLVPEVTALPATALPFRLSPSLSGACFPGPSPPPRAQPRLGSQTHPHAFSTKSPQFSLHLASWRLLCASFMTKVTSFLLEGLFVASYQP